MVSRSMLSTLMHTRKVYTVSVRCTTLSERMCEANPELLTFGK